jgi:hydroxymethylpyrimidine/phosphomethylpyrimidine kinase
VDFVAAQLEAILADLGVDSLKTGLLGRVDIIEMVTSKLASLDCPKVIDPVIVNGKGERIVEAGVLESYQHLFAQATLITPNLREAQHFSGVTIEQPDDMARAARVMLQSGAKAVLVKGGYLPERAGLDCLCVAGKAPVWLEDTMISTPNTHGTGCTLAAACATYLANEPDIAQAVRHAKAFVTGAIAAGATRTLGQGRGPVKHTWQHSHAKTANDCTG